MTVPRYHEMMLPVLTKLGDDPDRSFTNKQIREYVADCFALDDNDKAEAISSGFARYISNAQWACTYLKQARLIESPKRGLFKITPRGQRVLDSGVDKIDRAYLMQYPEFCEFTTRSKKNKAQENGSTEEVSAVRQEEDEATPDDIMEASFQSIQSALVAELLELIMQQSPSFFERLVVDLLLSMGYGDSRTDSGLVTKRTGDEGIDGVIREDKLGFDSVYIQAKRWSPERSVSRPDLQAFVGALTGAGAAKGLFITSAHFSKGAREYAEKQRAVKLVLVDGEQLARLMIAHGVGVSVRRVYEVKSVDRDYFEGLE